MYGTKKELKLKITEKYKKPTFTFEALSEKSI